jgi:hypothetical protein
LTALPSQSKPIGQGLWSQDWVEGSPVTRHAAAFQDPRRYNVAQPSNFISREARNLIPDTPGSRLRCCRTTSWCFTVRRLLDMRVQRALQATATECCCDHVTWS